MKSNYVPTSEIAELRQFFKSVELPKAIRLNCCTVVNDVSKFLNNHFEVLKKRDSEPHLIRLRELKKVLTK